MGSNYLQSHVMYLLADDSVPAAACEHLYPEQETPVPRGAAPAPAGRDTAQSYGRGKNIFLWFPVWLGKRAFTITIFPSKCYYILSRK